MATKEPYAPIHHPRAAQAGVYSGDGQHPDHQLYSDHCPGTDPYATNSVMATCLICTKSNRADIDVALLSGASLRGIAAQFGVSKTGAGRHRDTCLQPRVVAATRKATHASPPSSSPPPANTSPAAKPSPEPDDDEAIDMQGLLARTARSMSRLERAARNAADQGLYNALAAASGQLHKAVEMAARLQGIIAEPTEAAAPRFQLTINFPSGPLPQPGLPRPQAITHEVPTLILDVTPRVVDTALPPKPAGFKMPDFGEMTGDLVGVPLPAHLQA